MVRFRRSKTLAVAFFCAAASVMNVAHARSGECRRPSMKVCRDRPSSGWLAKMAGVGWDVSIRRAVIDFANRTPGQPGAAK